MYVVAVIARGFGQERAFYAPLAPPINASNYESRSRLPSSSSHPPHRFHSTPPGRATDAADDVQDRHPGLAALHWYSYRVRAGGGGITNNNTGLDPISVTLVWFHPDYK